MKRLNSLLLGTLAIFLSPFFSCTTAFAIEVTSAEDVLSGYAQMLEDHRRSLGFEASNETIRVDKSNQSRKTSKIKRTIVRSESIKGVFVDYEIYRPGEEVDLGYTKSLVTLDQKTSYSWKSGSPPRTVFIDRRPASLTLRNALLANVGPGRCLDGFGYGDAGKSIVEIVSEATSLQLRPKPEEVGGYLTHVLEADTKYGTYTLWIDTQHGYNPRRIEVFKSKGHLYHDTELGLDSAKPNDRASAELVIDNVEISKIGGSYIPTAARISRRTIYVDGQSEKEINMYKRENVDLDPNVDEFSKSFFAGIPDGTSVVDLGDRGSPGTKYEWIKGEVRFRAH